MLRRRLEDMKLAKAKVKAQKHGAPPPLSPLEEQLKPYAPMALNIGSVFSFRKGLSELPEYVPLPLSALSWAHIIPSLTHVSVSSALEKKLLAQDPQAAVLERSVVGLNFREKDVQVELHDGTKIEAEHVISSLPTCALLRSLSLSSISPFFSRAMNVPCLWRSMCVCVCVSSHTISRRHGEPDEAARCQTGRTPRLHQIHQHGRPESRYHRNSLSFPFADLLPRC